MKDPLNNFVELDNKKKGDRDLRTSKGARNKASTFLKSNTTAAVESWR